jgi:hypothetical protein
MPSPDSDFRVVDAQTRLEVKYSLHRAPIARFERGIAIHHGICHTRFSFMPLIAKLNERGIHVAMIEQQTRPTDLRRSWIGANSYRTGMKAAVTAIEKEMLIGCYALHSMGAMIGEEAQQKYEPLRRATVFLAPVPVWGAGPITWRLFISRPLDYLKAVFRFDIHSLADTEPEVRHLFFDRDTPAQIVADTRASLQHASFGMYVQLVFRIFVRPWIKDDGHAKLLLFSGTDEIFHERQYKNTRERFPRLETQEIPGGHDFFIQYAEATAESIAAFFEKHDRDEPPKKDAMQGRRADAPHEPRPPFWLRIWNAISRPFRRRTNASQEKR